MSNLYYRTPYLPLELAADLLISVAKETRGALLDTFRMKPMEDLNQVQLYCFPGESSKYRRILFTILQSWAEGHQIELEKGEGQDEQLDWDVQCFWLSALFNLGSPAEVIPVSDQFMAVVPIDSRNHLSALVHQLALNATYTRIAVAQDQDGTLNAIFHLKDDLERDSSLKSLVVSQLHPGLHLLKEYSDGQSSIFLPSDLTLKGQSIRPGQQGLELFCLFLRSAVRLAGKEPQQMPTESTSSELLAVILPLDSSLKNTDGGWRLLDLRSLRFQNQSQLVFRADDFTRVNVVALKSAPEYTGDTLRLAIQQADPPSGYSLQLRHTHLRLLYTQTLKLTETDIEIQEIHHQIEKLEYRLALIGSVSQRKPLLLRFTQHQLPALADYLRTLKPKGLANGILEYAYQSTDGQPSGYHYLWISPEILAEADITPLFTWPNLEEKRIFWLDPFWARYYPEDVDKGCYVFVPFEMTLFPTMHGWGDEKDMSSYLREVIHEWTHQEGISAPIPQQPIYVFDLIEKRERGTGLDRKIHIFVLDRDAFCPIKVNLPWINDCLVLHQELITQPTISALANAKTQEQLVNLALKQGEDLRRQVSETAEQIQKQVDATLTELTHAFVLQFEQLDKDTLEAVHRARELNQRLKDTLKEYDDLAAFLARVESTRNQIKNEADQKISEAKKLQEEVMQATKDAEEVQSKMKKITSSTIQELVDEEAAQRQRLDNFRF